MKEHYLQKIKDTYYQASELIAQWKSENATIVFTNGCFDIIHSGHLQYLYEARQLGDYLILGINDDNSVTRIKGAKRPILPLEERLAILSGFEMIDLLIPFSEDTPLNLIENIKPHILVKGGDYKISEIVGSDFVQSYGGRVQTLSFKNGSSSTNIIDIIIKRYSHD